VPLRPTLLRRAALPAVFLMSLASRAAAEKPLLVWAMGEEGKKISMMARKFEKLNPGVTVETQAIPWDAAHAKLLTAVVGGIPPDICQMGTTWMAEFVAMDALAPLDERAAQSTTARPDGFFKGPLQTGIINGSLYGIPWYVDTRVLFYRKDLLAEVGFKEPPKTWEELQTAARRLSARKSPDGRRNYGISLGSRGWPELLMAVWQNGADPLVPSSPEFQEAMNYYLSFFRENLTPTKEAADVNVFHAFKTGYLPMYISGPWMVSLTQKELPELEGQWGVSILPGKKSRTSFVGGSNLVIFKNSPRKDLAWRFIEFMSDPDVQAEWFEATSSLPSTKAAWKKDVFKDKPLIRVFGDQLHDTASPPGLPEWEQIAHAIENTMEKIILQPASEDSNIRAQLADLEVKILEHRSRNAPSSGSWDAFFWSIGLPLFIGAVLWFLTQYPRLKLRRESPTPWSEVLSSFLRKDILGYLFVMPALLMLAVFLFVPLAVSFLMSLTDLNIFNINRWGDIRFKGWENYAFTLKDPVFWKSLRNTLYFAGFGVPLTIAVSLFTAVALNLKFVRAKGLFRVALFSPVVTTIVAVAVVWRWIYNPEYGPLNWILESIGLSPLHWLADAKTAMPSLILMAVWKNFGYNMVIFLAGLQTIPESHYEAARIDGANAWQCFRFITVPGLAPTMLFVTILTTIGYLQFFAEPYVMTKGGPLDSTMSIVLYIYNQGFRFFNLGYASAVSYVLFGLIFCFTLLQLKLKKSGFDAS
jgi:ABC-type sugar transport system permease subunit/ABC-type glycerol-3-phosphate transport system substrate-binding protein